MLGNNYHYSRMVQTICRWSEIWTLCKYFMKSQKIRVTCVSAFICEKSPFYDEHQREATWFRRNSITFARVTSFIYVNSSWCEHYFFKIESSCFPYAWQGIYCSWEERLLFIVNGGDERWRSAFFLFRVFFWTLIISYGVSRIFSIICTVSFPKIYQGKLFYRR